MKILTILQVAFGMGINKPDGSLIHYKIYVKNIYYYIPTPF